MAVFARTFVRLRTVHRIYNDDVLLWFGLICMCAATGLFYSFISVVYQLKALAIDLGHHRPPLDKIPELLKAIREYRALAFLAWTAEFTMKLSLLLFFQRLVDRIPRLTLYVRFVMAFTTVAWILLMCEPLMTCPQVGMAVLSKDQMLLMPRS